VAIMLNQNVEREILATIVDIFLGSDHDGWDTINLTVFAPHSLLSLNKLSFLLGLFCTNIKP